MVLYEVMRGSTTFTEESVNDKELLKISGLVDFEIDPDDPYPDIFTGHVRLVYKDGHLEEAEQGFVRGGKDAPLSRARNR